MALWQCPNCGSSDFIDIAPGQRRCGYCGTTMVSQKARPEAEREAMGGGSARVFDVVSCPNCGFLNDSGANFCSKCGKTLWTPGGEPKTASWSGWPSKTSVRSNPAVISIIATLVGSMFVPIGGAVVGLVLGYRALREARAQGEDQNLAKAAIVIGWIGLAFNVLPICFSAGIWGFSICGGLFESLMGY